jgi:predicted dehydrogenase
MSRQKQIRRRDLLAAAVAVTGFPAIVPGRAFGANGRVTMASIGVGGQGGGHLRALTQMPEVRVVAACDVRQDRRDSAKQVVDSAYGDTACKTYNDFREVLARPDIDAILLAVPDHWHALIGLEAARRGKHMYYEKPMGISVAEAQAMRAAVGKYGVVFQFGTQQRSSFYYRQACELVRNGRIGELHTIMIGSAGGRGTRITYKPASVPEGFDYDFWLGPAPWTPYAPERCTRDFTLIYDYSLGCLSGAWGIHDIDIAQWVNDSDETAPIEVEGRGRYMPDSIYDTAYSFEVEHRYANGVKLVHMDIVTAKSRAEQFQFGNMASVFFGTEGWIWVSREGIRTQPESLARSIVGPNEKKVIFSNDHRRNFLDAVRFGGPTISPIAAAAQAEIVAQQADIAMRQKRRLRWDPAKEVFPGDPAANRMLRRPMRSPWRLEEA